MAIKKDKKVDRFKNCGLEFYKSCDSVEVWRTNREEQEDDDSPLGYITINYPVQVNFRQQVETFELELILEKAKEIESLVAKHNAELSQIVQL